ncbi:hypothetical protein QOL99_00280 [Deinococcus sp. MIMF12]|uniref:Uncharacterized protein n=1 Tax=Deinococcus rhizophilus TaxID=3049544 RepID=A0ABT7JC19_9DEIO|nr:hypothetical protein [Deinococcus rhizophilus]MDL2342585.1 hypothetical protein [Deinococcus rhizophilus]
MTCRLCGHPTAHHPPCPLDPVGRARALAAINSTGAVVPVENLMPKDHEDAAQIAYASRVFIPFCPETGLVLRGMYRGMGIRRAEEMEVYHLLKTHHHVRVGTVTLRPWWRWWKSTPHAVLTPSNHLEVLL